MKNFNNTILKFSTFIMLICYTSFSGATVINNADCSNSDVKVTHYEQYNNPGSIFNGSIDATECAGSFNGTPVFGTAGWWPNNNLGFDGDGFLNGGPLYPWSPSSVIFPDGAFVGEADKLDLNGDGTKDPGWVYLGVDVFPWDHKFIGAKVGVNLPDPAFKVPNDLFHFHFDNHSWSSGRWALTPDEDIPMQVEPWFGEEKFFDQFAMVVFGRKKEVYEHCWTSRRTGREYCREKTRYVKQFSVYDFTTEGLGLDPSTIGPGLDPYIFKGTFDVGGIMDKVYGIQLWARDPIETPEPGTISLIAFILLALGLKKRSQLNL